MADTINSYLVALEKELDMPRLAKRRVLRELRQHLTDAAADIGERAAIEALGSPQVVAARFAAEGRPHRKRYTTVTAIVAIGAAATLTVVVLNQGSSTPPVTTIAGLQLALSQEESGHYDNAHRLIVRTLSDHPEDWRLWLIRSRIESELGDIPSARQSLHHVEILGTSVEISPSTLTGPRVLPLRHRGTPRSEIISTDPSGLHPQAVERLEVASTTSRVRGRCAMPNPTAVVASWVENIPPGCRTRLANQ